VSTAERRAELEALRIDRSGHSRPSRRTLVIWLAGALVLLAAAGAAVTWSLPGSLAPAPAVRVGTIRVTRSTQMQTVLTATGYLESRLQASVGARAPGRIAEIHFEEGLQVEAGQLLAILEHADLDAALAALKVAVQQAKAELAEAKNHLVQADRDRSRQRAIFAKGAGSAEELETAETAFEAATARVEALTAAVAGAEARVVEGQEAVRNMYVYAPFAGTVISKDAELGETIMPGGMGLASGRGSVATLANLDQLEVDTDVKEDYLSQLRKGQPAEVVVDAVADRRYRGQLREIIPMGDRSRGIVKVKVTVLDADERLFPELSATVHFLPRKEGGAAGESTASKLVILAPEKAIVRRDGDTFVWRVDEERVRRVLVKVQSEPKDGYVAIEGSLEGGEKVVVDAPEGLADGSRVRLLQ